MSRSYRSPVRAEQALGTRRQLISAATTLFVSQGWSPTTMTRIAERAAVGRPTVYLHFDSKLDVLVACIDAALSDVPVRERADYQALGTGTMQQRTAGAARWLREAYQRSADIQRVLDQAAMTTPAAVKTWTAMEDRRHDEFANACRLVLDRRPPPRLVDEVWALGSRAMWFLLADRGWSPQQWERWYGTALLEAVERHT
jgi:TetR/AcrR family transcriptional regulator, cholesterol catabolism regulator